MKAGDRVTVTRLMTDGEKYVHGLIPIEARLLYAEGLIKDNYSIKFVTVVFDDDYGSGCRSWIMAKDQLALVDDTSI